MMKEPAIGFLSVFILISSALSLFFSIAFFIMSRGKRRANLILAILCLTQSIMMVDGFMNVTNYYGRYPHLIGLAWPVYFLIGPSYYFHIRELTSPKRLVYSWRHFFHFLPAIVSALLLIFFSQMRENENVPRLLCLIAPLAGITYPTLNGMPLLSGLQSLVYCSLSFLLIEDYRSRINQNFSAIETSNLSWFRTLLFSVFSLIFLYIFLLFFAEHLGINRESTYFFYFLWASSVYLMAFQTIIHPEMFSRIEAVHQTELRRTDPLIVPAVTLPELDKSQEALGAIAKEKYQRTLLSDARTAEIARQLLQFMETEKPYLEPELTMPELADKLAVFPHQLSHVINREMKKSFFDFINEYRVQEAKKLLRSPQFDHLSILGIALDAGFNSKSAFYRAFVKYAGMIPSEYRKQLERSG